MEKNQLSDSGHTYAINEQFVVQMDDNEDDADPLTAENTDDSNHDGNDPIGSAPLREQDRFLPIANVAKIMKKTIPDTGKIAKDARECVQECVSEFISFITSEASDRCFMEKRKTINGEDILFAMNSLGFENYVEPLKIYLQKYREAIKCDKTLQPCELTFDEQSEGTAAAVASTTATTTYGTPLGRGTIVDTTGTETIIYAYQDNLQSYQIT